MSSTSVSWRCRPSCSATSSGNGGAGGGGGGGPGCPGRSWGAGGWVRGGEVHPRVLPAGRGGQRAPPFRRSSHRLRRLGRDLLGRDLDQVRRRLRLRDVHGVA